MHTDSIGQIFEYPHLQLLIHYSAQSGDGDCVDDTEKHQIGKELQGNAGNVSLSPLYGSYISHHRTEFVSMQHLVPD